MPLKTKLTLALLTQPSKKKRAKMGEKKNPPRLDYMVGMLSALVRSCSTDAQADLGRPPTHLPNSTLLHMPEQDKELIYSNIFWKVRLGARVCRAACVRVC
jgi:hypothetical protein